MARRQHDPLVHAQVLRPFRQDLRLERFRFQGGLAAAYAAASSGSLGAVLVGELIENTGVGGRADHAESSPTPMAVKVILTTAMSREEWLAETYLLLRLRGAVDAARMCEAAGAPLVLADRGARHVAYTYCIGHEESLATLDEALPRVGAFLIALEPLEETLTSFIARRRTSPGTPVTAIAIEELLRISRDIALALAFLEQNRIVVRCLRRRASLSFRQNCVLQCCCASRYNTALFKSSPSSRAVLPRSTRTSSPTTSCLRSMGVPLSAIWVSGGCTARGQSTKDMEVRQRSLSHTCACVRDSDSLRA